MRNGDVGPTNCTIVFGGVPVFLICALLAGVSSAQNLALEDLYRATHDNNKVHGLGVVIGLDGTGDENETTVKVLQRIVERMRTRVLHDETGRLLSDALKNPKNVAIVYVSMALPANGDPLDMPSQCSVAAISARSLAGGWLLPTPLLGAPTNPRIQGFVEGPVTLNEDGPPTAGEVRNGYRPEGNSVSGQLPQSRVNTEQSVVRRAELLR